MIILTATIGLYVTINIAIHVITQTNILTIHKKKNSLNKNILMPTDIKMIMCIL